MSRTWKIEPSWIHGKKIVFINTSKTYTEILIYPACDPPGRSPNEPGSRKSASHERIGWGQTHSSRKCKHAERGTESDHAYHETPIRYTSKKEKNAGRLIPLQVLHALCRSHPDGLQELLPVSRGDEDLHHPPAPEECEELNQLRVREFPQGCCSESHRQGVGEAPRLREDGAGPVKLRHRVRVTLASAFLRREGAARSAAYSTRERTAAFHSFDTHANFGMSPNKSFLSMCRRSMQVHGSAGAHTKSRTCSIRTWEVTRSKQPLWRCADTNAHMRSDILTERL